jgi:hypothetical protein
MGGRETGGKGETTGIARLRDPWLPGPTPPRNIITRRAVPTHANFAGALVKSRIGLVCAGEF